MKSLQYIFFACLFALPAFSQQVDENETTFLYRQEVVGSATIHTHGWGAGIRYGRQKTVNVKHLFMFEFASMKHPKEVRTINELSDDSRGFVFGKLNSLTMLYPQYGQRRVLFKKLRERGVELGLTYSIGPSLGLLKPIYLEVCKIPPGSNQGCIPSIERYDPELHSRQDIFGKAPWTRGLSEIQLRPGLNARLGIYFEYSPDEDGIKAIEVGTRIDAFHKDIPIMALENNNQIYHTFYITLLFGKKLF